MYLSASLTSLSVLRSDLSPQKCVEKVMRWREMFPGLAHTHLPRDFPVAPLLRCLFRPSLEDRLQASACCWRIVEPRVPDCSCLALVMGTRNSALVCWATEIWGIWFVVGVILTTGDSGVWKEALAVHKWWYAMCSLTLSSEENRSRMGS